MVHLARAHHRAWYTSHVPIIAHGTPRTCPSWRMVHLARAHHGAWYTSHVPIIAHGTPRTCPSCTCIHVHECSCERHLSRGRCSLRSSNTSLILVRGKTNRCMRALGYCCMRACMHEYMHARVRMNSCAFKQNKLEACPHKQPNINHVGTYACQRSHTCVSTIAHMRVNDRTYACQQWILPHFLCNQTPSRHTYIRIYIHTYIQHSRNCGTPDRGSCRCMCTSNLCVHVHAAKNFCLCVCANTQVFLCMHMYIIYIHIHIYISIYIYIWVHVRMCMHA